MFYSGDSDTRLMKKVDKHSVRRRSPTKLVKKVNLGKGKLNEHRLDIEVSNLLAAGRYGVVVKGSINNMDNKKVAVKVMRVTSSEAEELTAQRLALTNLNSSKKFRGEGFKLNISKAGSFKIDVNTKLVRNDDAFKEVECMKQFADCPFIIDLIAFEERSPKGSAGFLFDFLFSKTNLFSEMWLVMDLFDNKTSVGFNTIATKESALHCEDLRTLISSVFLALKTVHDFSMAHRDVKPVNVLLKTRADGSLEKAVLCDFGVCSSMEREDVEIWKGTLGYLSPEYLTFSNLSCKLNDHVGTNFTLDFKERFKAAKRKSNRLSGWFNSSLKGSKVNTRLTVVSEKPFQAEEALDLCADSGAVDVWAAGMSIFGWVFGVNPFSYYSQEKLIKLLTWMYHSVKEEKMIWKDEDDGKWKLNASVNKLCELIYDAEKIHSLPEVEGQAYEGDNYFRHVFESRAHKYPQLMELLSLCLVYDASHRPSIEELLSHEFLTESVRNLRSKPSN